MKLEYGTKSLEYDSSGTATATKVTLGQCRRCYRTYLATS